MRTVSLLGSTGSIGRQAIEVCQKLGIRIRGLAAHSNTSLLAEQALLLKPDAVCIFDESKAMELNAALSNTNIEILTGMEGLCALASLPGCDTTLNAVVGMVGLRPTLAAIAAGRDVALANKETLVAGGGLVMDTAKQAGVAVLPVDSEHSAIFQSLQGNRREQVRRFWLTASGGPFFGKTRAELENVTAEEALRHPNWSMGPKVTVDSSTLMNKGLEVMEACWLFDTKPAGIEVIVHRESIIHSMVEYTDGALIAQLGSHDMRLPIQYALTWPERTESPAKPLDPFAYSALHFDRPDEDTFECLAACRRAMELGGLYPAMVNGANEQAVELFLQGKLRFLEIGRLVSGALALTPPAGGLSVENIFAADLMAREYVRRRCGF